MKTAIMQPYFFPYLGYFQLIRAVDVFVFYDDVNYIKKGWIHRNRIRINDEIKYFGAQLSKPSQNKKINEVELNSDPKWQANLLKTLRLSYGKAKHFEQVHELIEKNVLNGVHKTVDELAEASVTMVCEYLNIGTKLIASSQCFPNTQYLKKQDRLIEICKQLESPNYINAIGGSAIYTKEQFAEQGINLSFIQMEDTGLNNQYLSIIDLLMHNDKDCINKSLESYTLI